MGKTKPKNGVSRAIGLRGQGSLPIQPARVVRHPSRRAHNGPGHPGRTQPPGSRVLPKCQSQERPAPQDPGLTPAKPAAIPLPPLALTLAERPRLSPPRGRPRQAHRTACAPSHSPAARAASSGGGPSRENQARGADAGQTGCATGAWRSRPPGGVNDQAGRGLRAVTQPGWAGPVGKGRCLGSCKLGGSGAELCRAKPHWLSLGRGRVLGGVGRALRAVTLVGWSRAEWAGPRQLSLW